LFRPENLLAVPAHPNENADQEHEHQIKRNFLFGVHPHIPEQRSRIATATLRSFAQTKRQIFATVIRAAPGHGDRTKLNYNLREVVWAEKPLESRCAGAIVSRRTGVRLCGKRWTKVKIAALLHCWLRHPPDAVRENGTDGGQGKAVGCVSADGFAVCGFRKARVRNAITVRYEERRRGRRAEDGSGLCAPFRRAIKRHKTWKRF
jgi:hypothetical protein